MITVIQRRLASWINARVDYNGILSHGPREQSAGPVSDAERAEKQGSESHDRLNSLPNEEAARPARVFLAHMALEDRLAEETSRGHPGADGV